ncbi:hypothetical protein T4A_10498 [Trichinella pseudospiralis]|uniref:Uncharacterized protein n=1 Tax=Trichinella pseudospiralis TaxID=6337 RepID=A0A0V1CQ35_TRIPS|nr:hypothetical protein T4A_10498 [Trichinella pseudospiralis]
MAELQKSKNKADKIGESNKSYRNLIKNVIDQSEISKRCIRG